MGVIIECIANASKNAEVSPLRRKERWPFDYAQGRDDTAEVILQHYTPLQSNTPTKIAPPATLKPSRMGHRLLPSCEA
jgi:hypothetical protein